MYSEIEKNITKLQQKCGDIRLQAMEQDRKLKADESDLISQMESQIESLRMQLPVDGPVTMGNGVNLLGGGSGGISNNTFGFENVGDIMAALYRKSRGEGYDNRLANIQIKASAIGETVPSEGGFAIPTQFVSRALNEGLEDTVLLQLCDREIMTTNEMSMPAFVDNDRSSTAPFGISWGQIQEAGSWGNVQSTPFRGLSFSAKKSGAIFAASNEWLADSSISIKRRLENVWRASLRWYIESMLWAGTGAGMPLGATVGDGAVEVDIEGGQADQTVVTENIVKMWSRLRPGSHSRAIWACNATVFPQLATLSLSVGTGGAPVSLLQPLSIAGAPSMGILGRPLYMTEHLPALGNAGDLVLLDPALYLMGDRQQVILDVSPHALFTTDQTAFRVSARLDAMPIYSTPAHARQWRDLRMAG